jgi:hydroxyacylglutathione hydrolase
MRLQDDIRVYCGHEYTESNLRFAMSVEPSNPKLAARNERVQGLRARGTATVPSTLEEEKLTNPFLRWDSKEIQANVKSLAPDTSLDPVSVFAAVRKMKDAF